MHADNQAFKEERAMIENNNLFGKFHLAGIMPAPRGLPQVEVTFDIDGDGTLDMPARDECAPFLLPRRRPLRLTPFSMALISSLSFLSKAQFEQLHVGKFHESRGGVSLRQRDCNRNVHDVALVGGSARIPIVQKMFQESFNRKEQKHSAELVVLSSLHTEIALPIS